MGLTIHYRLGAEGIGEDQARQHVEQLHRRATELPFAKVLPIVEFSPDPNDDASIDRESPHAWLLIQAERHVQMGDRYHSVPPTQVIAFTTLPGEGCESANFGLCRYPTSIVIGETDDDGPQQRVPTKLRGWSWASFCKTQYASNPQCGGLENFLRCHLGVIGMLDCAKELGILEEVVDEGGYWEQRDAEALTREIARWNEMIAGVFGRLKDSMGEKIVGEIASFPDFEHLEARDEARRKTGDAEQN